MTEDQHEAFVERAAIHEYEGGMTRPEAEQAAAVATRPLTDDECVEWLIKQRHHGDEYFQRSLRIHAKHHGREAAERVATRVREKTGGKK